LPVAAAPVTVEVASGTEAVAEQSLVLAADHVRLWQLDAPVLYEVRTGAGDHAADPVTFGLRRFEMRGTQLLLNGHPIRLAGANWHASHPDWGQNQPAAGVIRDLQLLKEGGFVLQRFAHYPVSPAILDWADRHGLLFIAEAGNTGGSAEQLASADRRAKFQTMHR
jgi:beta-glucuronidase